MAVDEVNKRVVKSKLSSSSISYQNKDIGPHHHHQRYHSLFFFSPPHGKNVSPHGWGWSMLSSRIMDVRRRVGGRGYNLDIVMVMIMAVNVVSKTVPQGFCQTRITSSIGHQLQVTDILRDPLIGPQPRRSMYTWVR